MRARLIFCTAAGEPIFSMDGAHGDDHAQRVIAENLALLEARGIEAMVIDYDPMHGADDVLDAMTHLSSVALEVRTRPDGKREVIDVHIARPGGRHSIARALRVLHAPAEVINPRAQLHRRARGTTP